MLHLAQPFERVVPHMGYGYHYWMGPLTALVVVGLLVLGAVLIVRTISSRPTTSHGHRSGPLHILEERFARGEIDEDEFRRRREALRT
jgi:putative membrane protein